MSGRARGVIAILELDFSISSSSSFLGTDLESRLNPARQIKKPPVTFKTGIVIPKKLRIYSPIKKDIIRITKTLIATQRAILFFVAVVSPCVSPRNTGRFPMGFKTENKAANVIKNKFILILILVKGAAKIILFLVFTN